MDIKQAVNDIFEEENITNKQELDLWCGNKGREKLYFYVKRMAPEHWKRILTPENSVRYYYQTILPGYKIYNL